MILEGKQQIEKLLKVPNHLSQFCLSKEEQEEIYKLLVKYKEAFSLRDEIGMCPNIEVDLQVLDKSPFFIRPFHVKK